MNRLILCLALMPALVAYCRADRVPLPRLHAHLQQAFLGEKNPARRLAQPVHQIRHIAQGQHYLRWFVVQDRHPKRALHLALGQFNPPSPARALGAPATLSAAELAAPLPPCRARPPVRSRGAPPGHSPATASAAQLLPQVIRHLLGGRQHAELFYARKLDSIVTRCSENSFGALNLAKKMTVAPASGSWVAQCGWFRLAVR
jgi:hypothetical protein